MARKNQKKHSKISDEMEARIKAANANELGAINQDAATRFASAVAHMKTDKDIVAARDRLSGLTQMDREDKAEAAAIMERVRQERMARGG